jgi:hypothetical protein
MMGEGKATKAAERWSCGDCAAEGKEFSGEEANVILHSVKIHGAYTVSRDTASKVVRVQTKT